MTDIVIRKGKTFRRVVRYMSLPYLYKAITAVTKGAPCRLTVPAHDIPDGWRVAPVSIVGMTELNVTHDPPWTSDYLQATVVDVDTIDLNAVNSSGFTTYVSGGYLQLYTPKSLAGATARMTVRNRKGGTELESFTVATSRIELDDTTKTITVLMSDTDTAAITWSRGVYDLEYENAAGETELVLEGSITAVDEVTT